ncbi:MAG: carboxylesterase family protein [Acinetobacter sp.]
MKNKIIAGLLLGLSTSSHAASSIIHVTGGRIIGTEHNGITAFKGIPYAAPPVGELRWQAPHPVKPWRGILQATNYGNDCLQQPFPGDAAPLGVGLSEDCLTINVWKPTKAQGKLPVMVWIYGGGFVNGGSSPAVYAGDQFAKNGVVFVSFNYRVGRFGFFAHPSLANQKLRGNYALMDQIAALKWVQQNIQKFNGDPQNVTLFGESAGGYSVNSLLLTDLTTGLFQKAIIQSGSGRHNMVPNQTWQQAEKAGIAFANKHHIQGTDADALAALRKIPANEVVDGLNMATMRTADYSGPMIDGRIITNEPLVLYREGKFHKVPLIIGANEADLGFAPKVETVEQALSVFPPNLQSKARQAYNNLSAQAVAQAIASDAFMVEPARYMARVWSQYQVPVWQYRFGYVATSVAEQMRAAAHATEIPYIFNTLKARYGSNVTIKDQAVADQMQQYWVNFARTGNPDHPTSSAPKWSTYSTPKDNILIVPTTGAHHIQEQADPWRDRLDVVEGLVNLEQ